jgi:fructose-1,6-bisphosphatase II
MTSSTSDDCLLRLHRHHAGQLVQGVQFKGQGAITQTLVMRGKSGTVRLITARHRFEKLRQYANIAY